MSGTSEAVTQATRLSEIGFPEFTTKLISDVFDALVSSNIRQTEAFIELLQQTSKSLTAFINDTKDDISGEMILDFLAKALPAPVDDQDKVTAVENNGGTATLTEDQANQLNDALALPSEAGVANDNKVASSGDNNYDSILDAVALRISANKYDLLKEMVKQGILRLVIENGDIETRLTFTTYGSSFSRETQNKYNRKAFSARARAKTGSALSPWVKASASTKYSNVTVSTTSKTDQDRSGSRVNIFGGVKINFRTDYLPLDQ
ncbi:hypothetical protein [Agaribacter flavus]|uniref:Uncharacterized protein n=1 Tax=Agaribacter flavus TaxID=1902781 RepID=A0ABV7FT09_9ALTE